MKRLGSKRRVGSELLQRRETESKGHCAMSAHLRARNGPEGLANLFSCDSLLAVSTVQGN